MNGYDRFQCLHQMIVICYTSCACMLGIIQSAQTAQTRVGISQARVSVDLPGWDGYQQTDAASLF